MPNTNETPYSPEPGGSLAYIRETEELGAIKDAEQEQQAKDNPDFYDKDWESWMMDERDKENLRNDTFLKRVERGQVSAEYTSLAEEESPWSHLSSEAHAREMAVVTEEGDEQLTNAEIGFFVEVFPELEQHIETALAEAPEEDPRAIIDAYLDGKDLK